MSLARVGCDGSDVYVYEDADPHKAPLTCQYFLHHFNGDAADMIEHLHWHEVALGHTVPASCTAELQRMVREGENMLRKDRA